MKRIDYLGQGVLGAALVAMLTVTANVQAVPIPLDLAISGSVE
jgi:hypothetical protein